MQNEDDLASLISDIRRTELAPGAASRATQDTTFSARPSVQGSAQTALYEDVTYPAPAQRASIVQAVPQVRGIFV